MTSPNIQSMMGEYDTKHQEAQRVLGLSSDIATAVSGGATSGSDLVDVGIKRLGAYTAETGEHFQSLEEKIAASVGKVAILTVKTGHYAGGDGRRRILPSYSLTYYGLLESDQAIIDEDSLQLRLPTTRYATRGASLSQPLMDSRDSVHEGSMPLRDYEEGYRAVAGSRRPYRGYRFEGANYASALGQMLFEGGESPTPHSDYNRSFIETGLKIVTRATVQRNYPQASKALETLELEERIAAAGR